MYRFPTPSAVGLGQGPHWSKFTSTTLHVTGISLAAVSAADQEPTGQWPAACLNSRLDAGAGYSARLYTAFER